MLRLKSVTMRHWQRVRQATVKFPESGFVLVRGRNLTRAGKFASIGAGKTSLGEALVRSLFGVEGKYSNLGWYSTDEEGDTYVRTVAELDGRDLTVEMGWKCAELSPTGEGLRFLHDGAKTERPHPRETRAALSALIGVSPELAGWSIFLDGERLRFNKLSQTDSVELLMQALSQPNWDNCRDRAAKRLQGHEAGLEQTRERLAGVRAEHARVSERIADAEKAVEEAETRDANAKQRHDQQEQDARRRHAAGLREVTDLETQLKAAHKEIDKAVAEADTEYRKAEHRASALASQLATARSYLDGWREEVSRLEPLWRDAAKLKDDLEVEYNGKCSRCGQPLPNRPKLAEVARAKAEAAKLSADLAAARGQAEIAQKDVEELGELHDLARAKARRNPANKTETLSLEYERLENEVARARQRADELQEALNQVVASASASEAPAARAVLAERVAARGRAEQDIQAQARELARLENESSYDAYWARAFSPTGIPNLVLRRTIRPLNEAARLTSLTMTGGALEVTFSATTELASGVEKPQLVTRVDNRYGASRFQGNSKGEAGLANLILAETQATVGRIGRRVGWRWFDEPLNTQDPQVRRNVYQYLRQQADAEGLLIFVVDHNPEAAGFAHHVLVATKSEAGDTTYAWE